MVLFRVGTDNKFSFLDRAPTANTSVIAALAPVTRPPEPPSGLPTKQKKLREFDPSRYSTRLIALKLAYLGGAYNGFEHQGNPTPLPTVEEKLFEALLKSCLVAPLEPELEDPSDESGSLVRLWPGEEITQYSKAGRTDRGVSAFGQVVGIRVRSNRPLSSRLAHSGTEKSEERFEESLLSSPPTPAEFDDVKDELPYVQILNRLLPPDIRVLAWAPTPPPDFSARFNCRGRHYKYFFSNPAIPPRIGAFTGELDIPRMREAAAYFLGEHDFRNFCKLDASKQINNFKRIIYESSIEEIPIAVAATTTASIDSTPLSPKVYYFNLRGSAFLWHQVRHMIAILFLIGQRLEEPSIIKELLDSEKNPRKPHYEMADDMPLVLWDCYFPEGELNWEYGSTVDKIGLMDTVWMGWHKAQLDQVLRTGLMGIAEDYKRKAALVAIDAKRASKEQQHHILVDGGNKVLHRGKYVPIMQRPRMEHVHVLNEKYRNKKPERVSKKGKTRNACEGGSSCLG